MSEERLPRGVYLRPILEEKHPEKASQTLLNKISDCPFSGALYLDFKGGSQSHAMARGEAIHACFEACTNMALESGETTVPPEVAKDVMQALLDERTDLAMSPAEHEACRIAAWNWGRFTVLDPEHIVCVETMLELEVGGWMVRGKIDRASIRDGQGWVYDYKTGLYLPSQEEHENDFQQQFYGLLLAEGVPEGETVPLGRGIDGVNEIAVYPRIVSDTSMFTRDSFKDRGQIFDFKRTVESALAKLEHGLLTGQWKASAGDHCSVCPAPQECPIPEAERPAVVANEGQALEVGEEILTLEERLKALKKAEKLFVEENGAVNVGGRVFDIRPSRSVKKRVKQEELDAALEGAGLDPTDYFRVELGTTFGHKKVQKETKAHG